MPATESNIRELPVADIIPTPDNPRVIDEKAPAFLELVDSVKGQGVLVPVLVRPHPDKRRKNKWDLRYGERRVRAATAAGLDTVPAIVRDLTDDEAFELTFAENYGREDLTPLEEGRAVETLAAKFNGDVKAIAAKLGRSEKWVHLRMRLKDLSASWRDEAAKNPLVGIGHLALLARFDEKTQEAIYEENNWTFSNADDIPTLADWDAELNSEWVRALAAAPFDLDDATLDKKAGACTSCIKRSSAQGQLWHEPEETAEQIAKSDRCLDNDCWHRKLQAHGAARLKILQKEHPDAIPVSVHPCYSSALRDTREASKAFANAMASDSYTEVKKPGADTVEAIVVDGPEPGRLIHIKKSESGRGRGVSSSSSSGPKAKSTPTPLKERRKVLESKRWFEVLKRLEERIENMDAPLCKDLHVEYHVLCLAAAFGTDRHAGRHGYCMNGHWERLHAYRDNATNAKFPHEATEALWQIVRPVLCGLFRYAGPITQTPDYVREEAKKVAELCHIDIDEIYAAACETYKEPKSWKSLNEDGTPRQSSGQAPKTNGKPKTKTKAKSRRSSKSKGGKPLPVFSSEQLAEARKRPRIEIPDGPSLLIIHDVNVSTKNPEYKQDVFSCWWISPAGETEKRLPKREYPDCDDVADAIEDISSFANEHGHEIINPVPVEES